MCSSVSEKVLISPLYAVLLSAAGVPVATSPATAVYMLKILNLKLLQMAPPSASVVGARNEAMDASVNG